MQKFLVNGEVVGRFYAYQAWLAWALDAARESYWTSGITTVTAGKIFRAAVDECNETCLQALHTAGITIYKGA